LVTAATCASLGGERAADVLRAGVEERNVFVPAAHKTVVVIDYLGVLFPERLPGPAAVDQLHVEGLPPALHHGSVLLDMLPQTPDEIGRLVSLGPEVGNHTVALPELVTEPADIILGVVIVLGRHVAVS
jgi:hypothetical protein